MFITSVKIRRPAILGLLALAVMALGTARALDFEEVKVLVRNNVAEEVIINMVKGDGTIYTTLEQAGELRALGASENLVAAMRPTATTLTDVSAYPSAAPATTFRTPTVITDSTPGQTVVQAPATIVSEPVVVSSGMLPDGAPISPVAITSSSAYPPRFAKEGWVSFANHDWIPYYVNINPGSKRIFLSKFPNGGAAIESGSSLVVNLRKETYKMYGDSGEDLKVKVRENETTSVALNPYGVFGNSGLTGVSVDRDKVRSEVLFRNYAPPPAVVVQEAPVVVVPAAPPPVFYHPYPRYRHGGDSFYFGYRRW